MIIYSRPNMGKAEFSFFFFFNLRFPRECSTTDYETALINFMCYLTMRDNAVDLSFVINNRLVLRFKFEYLKKSYQLYRIFQDIISAQNYRH